MKHAWHESEWKATRDAIRGITAVLCCSSASPDPTTGQAPIDYAGGRSRFGYTSTVAPVDKTGHAKNLEKLWRLMAGLENSGNSRPASLAIEDGRPWEYDDAQNHLYQFVMRGNGWTVLAPSPQYVFPALTYPERMPGAAVIVFDAYMYTGEDAGTAVLRSTGPSISPRRWFGAEDSDDRFGISCDFYKPMGSAVRHTLTAIAEKCRNSNPPAYGRHKLDGNKLSPNGDDKTWSF